MDFLGVIKTRRSIREYSDKQIKKELLEKIVDSARFSPTARNIQPWEFIVVTQGPVLRKLGELAESGRFLALSKACIAVFCSDTKYYLEDGCAATCNILLAASGLGIGSCWVAGDKKPYCRDVAELLNVPGGYKLISLVALGYPKSKGCFYAAEKKDLSKVIHWEKF
ncbi:MAG: nitroreductase family protein [Candidatus Omnitrophica bacterium]|nr:nitroreductase family protein [Candidatus Omnitrophota bacterium]MDD5553242.1 nitroreductase family protein [Candidatus Omnitrophota bacterium]